jgi:pimeloyl-ACP methyl ester carboxylesterase
MNCEIVRTRTADGLALEGLWSEPAAGAQGAALLHIHGFAGNFYANPFVDELGRAVTARGHAFLTVNTRGHDAVAEIHRRTADGSGYTPGGAAYEDFTACVTDIGVWLDVLGERGRDRVVLCGHSAGALKAAHYQAARQDRRVRALVFLAPPDVLGLQEAGFGARWAEDVRQATEWVDAGQGDRLMPAGASRYPVSARTYLSYLSPTGAGNIFDFTSPAARFETLARLRQPLLAVMGSEDRTVLGDVAACLAQLKARAAAAPRCDTVVIPGAAHAFAGHEPALARAVAGWMSDVLGLGPPRPGGG